MAQAKLQMEGMSCMHCVKRVKQALDVLEGVSDSDVQVNEATITYDESKVSKKELEAAVQKAGYKVRG